MTEKRNEVISHGFDDVEAPEWLEDKFTISIGQGLKDLNWKHATMSFSDFFTINAEHKKGQKEGSSFMQGALADDGARRLKPSVTELNILALDIDHGAPISDMIESIKKQGLFALLYTSHSHNKDVTNVLESTLFKKLDKPSGHDFTEDELCGYLTTNMGYHPSVLKDDINFERKHLTAGMSYAITHNVMPRYRVVFVLTDPFYPADTEGYSQPEGMQLWAKKYAGVAQMLDTYYDSSCTDVSRLFYQPRHAPGADHEVHLINGDTLDLMSVKDGNPKGFVPKTGNAFIDSMEADDELSGDNSSLRDRLKYKWLIKFFAIHNKGFQTYDFFEEYGEDRGGEKDGKGSFKCPNDEAHSDAGNPDDAGFYTTNPGHEGDGEGGTASCSHSSCKNIVDRIEHIEYTMLENNLDEKDLLRFVSDLEGSDTVESLEALLDDDVEVGDFTPAIEELGMSEKDFNEKNDDTQDIITRISIMPKTNTEATNAMYTMLAKTDLSSTMEQIYLDMIAVRNGYSKRIVKTEYKDAKKVYVEKNESVKDKKDKAYPSETKKALRRMNKKQATIFRGSTLFVMKDRAYLSDPAKYGIDYQNPASVKLDTTHETLRALDHRSGEIASQLAHEVWMAWPDRRRFKGITFDPSIEGHIANKHDEPDEYNLWNGWAIDPDPNGNCDILLDHIKTNICRGDAVWYHYFMTYFAHMMQRPNEIPSVAVVVQGEKGCGKSIVFEDVFVHKLCSPYGMTTANSSELFGDFNARVENKLMVVMSEAFWGGDKSVESMMKDAITGKNMTVKRKNVDNFDVPNYRRFCCTANDTFVVPATKNERRYFVLECSDERVADVEYFGALKDQLNNEGGFGKFMDILLKWEEPKPNWRSFLWLPPVTPWLKIQIGENKQPWEKWIDSFIYDGKVTAPMHSEVADVELLDDTETLIPQKVMSDWWRYNCGNNKHNNSAKKCTSYIMDTYKVVKRVKKRVNKTDSGSSWCFIFPPRNELMEIYPELFREEWMDNEDHAEGTFEE